MTRVPREARRSQVEAMHGPFANIPMWVKGFLLLFKRGRERGITILNFSQWRAKKWGGPCHSPADELERFQYRAYVDQMTAEVMRDKPAE